MVSIKFMAKLPQTKERFIRPLWRNIDKKPETLAGAFPFSPLNGKTDLAMWIWITGTIQVLDIIAAGLGLALFVEDLYICCKLKSNQLIRIAWHRNE